jgi:hypothetical protein
MPRAPRRVIRSLLIGIAGQALLVTALVGPAMAVVDGSPIAQWSFDDASGTTASDAIGSLDGGVSGATWIADGFAGHGLRFDGIDDVVTIPADPAFATPRLAVSLWIRSHNAPPADGSIVLERGDRSCGGGDYAIAVDGAGVELRIRDDSTGQMVRFRVPAGTLASLWEDAWHHVGLNYVADDYGAAALLVDGRVVAGGTIAPLKHAQLDTAVVAIGRAARADCGRPAFAGDIDEVRLFDDVMTRDGFGSMEPPIATSTSIEHVNPLTVGMLGTVTVKVSPVPISGWLRASFVGADAVEHPVGLLEIPYWMPRPADGIWTMSVNSDWGGDGTLIVRADLGSPHLDSSDSAAVTIAKLPVSVSLWTQTVNLAGDPIQVAARIGTVGANVFATGTVELWDVTVGPGTQLASKAIVVNPSSNDQFVDFDLPPRGAGTYRLEVRYLGGSGHLPGTGAGDLIVLAALVPGGVTINGGDQTTDDPIVTVSAPAVGAVALLISTDPADPRRQFTAPYGPDVTTWLTAPWYGDDADGVRTIWVKWADAQSHWSDWQTDTIVLERSAPAGSVSINGGATYATTGSLQVGVPVANPAEVSEIGLSTDGANYSSQSYAPTVALAVPSIDGPVTVYARWKDRTGHWSRAQWDSIVVDRTAPTSSAPVATFRVGTSLSSGSVSTRFSWTGADARSGIDHYQFALSTDGGLYRLINGSLASPALTKTLASGHRYRAGVRAVDRAGNVGAWTYGPSFRVSRYEETSGTIRWSSGWRTATSSAYSGGHSRFASGAGSGATFTFSGRSVAWVGSVGPTRGWASVYVNGALVASVNLFATSTHNQRVLFSKTWSTSAARTIRIRISGTVGHPRGDIDAFVVS